MRGAPAKWGGGKMDQAHTGGASAKWYNHSRPEVDGRTLGPARKTLPSCKPRIPGQAFVASVPSAMNWPKYSRQKEVWQPMGPARKTLPICKPRLPGQAFAASVHSDKMRTNQNLGCGTKVRTTSFAISLLEAIGGSRGEHTSCSSSVSQTFAVPTSTSIFPGLLPAEGFVKEADVQPGAPPNSVELGEPTSCSSSVSQTFAVPASTSTLPCVLPVKGFVKEADLQPGAPAKGVKLDGKRSDSGSSPGAPGERRQAGR